MTGVLLRGIALRKLRIALTAIGVVLGVAMISGTLVLTDTIMSAFDSVFGTAYVHTDAVVVARAPFGATGADKPSVPASLLTRIRALPEVARAHGYLDAKAQLVDARGKVIGGSEEALLFGLDAVERDATTPLTLTAGTWPSGSHDLLVDATTARTQHLAPGATVGLVARGPRETFRVVGVFQYAGESDLGTQMLAVDLTTAQRLGAKTGLVDEIDVAKRPGVSTAALLSSLRAALPATAKATTATDQAAQATSEVGEQFVLLQYVLLAFGAVALFVASFIILNTLSLTVTQRMRELGTLRALGATPRQVFASVLGEGLAIGVIGSVLGLGLGIGFAKGLNAFFAAGGIHLPSAALVFSGRTVLAGLGAGVGLTLAASITPALRATRVPPIAAIRADAGPATGQQTGPGSGRAAAARVSWIMIGAGVAAAATLIVSAVVDASTSARLALLGGGALLAFLSAVGLTRLALPGLAGMLVRPLRALGHGSGELACDGVRSAPARSASVAASLTVGVCLMVLASVLAQGMQHSIGNSLRAQLRTGYVVTATRGLLPTQVHQALDAAGLPSAGLRSGTVHTFDDNQDVTGVTPADLARFYRFTWADRTPDDALTRLDDSGALISQGFATAHTLHLGSTFTAQTTSGTLLSLTVRGIYLPPSLSARLGAVTITTTLFDRSFTGPGDTEVYVGAVADSGTGSTATTTAVATRAGIQAALAGFPTADVRSFTDFVTLNEAPIADLLNLFTLLLALSIAISLIGIVNILALAVTERTREIGALRAIGMTRPQVGRMIRIESQLICLVGAAIGIGIGLLLAAAAAGALSSWNLGYTPPWLTLLALLAAAFVAGSLAGALPARRAARLNPLAALAYE